MTHPHPSPSQPAPTMPDPDPASAGNRSRRAAIGLTATILVALVGSFAVLWVALSMRTVTEENQWDSFALVILAVYSTPLVAIGGLGIALLSASTAMVQRVGLGLAWTASAVIPLGALLVALSAFADSESLTYMVVVSVPAVLTAAPWLLYVRRLRSQA